MAFCFNSKHQACILRVEWHQHPICCRQHFKKTEKQLSTQSIFSDFPPSVVNVLVKCVNSVRECIGFNVPRDTIQVISVRQNAHKHNNGTVSLNFTINRKFNLYRNTKHKIV